MFEENRLLFADEDQEIETQEMEEDVQKKQRNREENHNWKILIIDDDQEIHSVTKLVLADLHFENEGIDFISAYSGKEAQEIVHRHPNIAVILLDVVMEEDDSGLQFIKYIREVIRNRFVRIILRTGQPGQVPEKSIIMEYDINDYKEKTELTAQSLFTSIISSLRSYRDLSEIQRLNDEIEHTQRELIYTFGEIAENRSKETGYHVKRVAEYSATLASLYGLPSQEVELIRLASPMHDIGKVAIPDEILNKPGKYTNEEYDIMKTHCHIGYEMLKHSHRGVIKAASIIALHHHEKYNGTGYPNGLSGNDIHLYGRITAIADVFDALGTERVYKKAWPLDEIIDLIKKERGQHFDPILVDKFLQNLDQFIAIKDRLQET